MQFKSLEVKQRVIKVTFEKYGEFQGKKRVNEIQAICCLTGGYNKFGRNIDIEKYNELVERFNDIIEEVIELAK